MKTLIMKNCQGASETTHHDSVEDCIEQINSWADPENMSACIIDNNGQESYDGNAGTLVDAGNIEDAIERLNDSEND